MLKPVLAFSAHHWRALSGLALVALTLLSLMPMPAQGPVAGSDKVLHIMAWGLAVVPASLALGRRALPVVLAFLAWSIAIEFLQPLSGRFLEMADMLANGAGLALGALSGMALRRRPTRE
ncbi:MAG: hypothetical protein RIC38_11725 [Chromatocurvus sp.]